MGEKQEFEKALERLRKYSEDKIIIVEGKKDKHALESFGIKNIITLSMPLYKIVEKLVSEGKGCIILTDLDKKGKELYSRLVSGLNRFGVRTDDAFREFLFTTKLRQIEGIARYLKRLG